MVFAGKVTSETSKLCSWMLFVEMYLQSKLVLCYEFTKSAFNLCPVSSRIFWFVNWLGFRICWCFFNLNRGFNDIFYFLAATAAQEVHLSLRVFVCSCVVNLSKHSAPTVLRLQLHKCSNVAMQKCSNVEMYKCSNVAM